MYLPGWAGEVKNMRTRRAPDLGLKRDLRSVVEYMIGRQVKWRDLEV